MRPLLLLFPLLFAFATQAQRFSAPELARWQQQARQVTIIRDTYGVPHIYGKTKVATLAETLDDLTRDYGTWKTMWGDVNRYQRLTGRIVEQYDDQLASWPVPFASSAWGALAAFGARSFSGTKRRYGTVGNSFVAVVEFGPRIVARSVVTGGQASRPDAPRYAHSHFLDQADLYVSGRFKEVRFYPEDVRAHAEYTYHPGE